MRGKRIYGTGKERKKRLVPVWAMLSLCAQRQLSSPACPELLSPLYLSLLTFSLYGIGPNTLSQKINKSKRTHKQRQRKNRYADNEIEIVKQRS
jgi:hypothetical protein